MKTQNLAVMFTDIAGFTARTSAQTREENARMMRRHDALLVSVIRGFGGRSVKSVGDALLVVFGSPTDSVLCGMAIRDRLWAASEDCATRRGAARALAATGSREAMPALRSLADGGPAAPEPDPIEGVKRLFGADGRCGAGDLARDAIRELGESP